MLSRHARKLRLAAFPVLVVVAGFATARLSPDHTATPRWISGTVTWSNADIHRVLFEAHNDSDDSDDSGEYEVAAVGRMNKKNGAYFSSGLPICLAAQGTEFVRTDRRRVELGVISVSESDRFDYRVSVVVRCLT
ncbi:hypothetical protein GCM10025331_59720 [Actinoplanes utahensis]|nr:hypothetical protein Aut01nite_69580 [Actinoplanes utahensis]